MLTPEAAARIGELGFQAYVDRMIADARENLPDVARIEVVLHERYDLGGEPGVCVDAYSYRDQNTRPTFWALARWAVATFPPEVLQHVHISYYAGPHHAG
jgi:hypothetical protein